VPNPGTGRLHRATTDGIDRERVPENVNRPTRVAMLMLILLLVRVSSSSAIGIASNCLDALRNSMLDLGHQVAVIADQRGDRDPGKAAGQFVLRAPALTARCHPVPG